MADRNRRSHRIALKSLGRFVNTRDNPITIDSEMDDFSSKGCSVIDISSSSCKPKTKSRASIVNPMEIEDSPLIVTRSRSRTSGPGIVTSEVEMKDPAPHKSSKKDEMKPSAPQKSSKKDVTKSPASQKSSRKTIPTRRMGDYCAISIRTTTRPLCETIRLLNSQQRATVEAMGFKKILDFCVDGIPRCFSHFVLDKFCPEQMCLILESGRIDITVEKIRSIFGIPFGGRQLASEDVDDIGESAFKEWAKYYGSNAVKSNDIKDRIISKGNADRLFELDFILLFVNCLVECGKAGDCKLDVLTVFGKTEEVQKLDWCLYVVNKIRSCKQGWEGGKPTSIFAGPLPVLVMIYLDGTKCNDANLSRKTIPIREWKFAQIRKREKFEIEGYVEVVAEGSSNMDVDDDAPKVQEEAPHDVGQASSSRPSVKVFEEKLARIHADLILTKNELEGVLFDAIGHYPEHSFWNAYVDSFPKKAAEAADRDGPAKPSQEPEAPSNLAEKAGNEQHPTTPPSPIANPDSERTRTIHTVDDGTFTEEGISFLTDPEVLMLVDEVSSAFKSSGRAGLVGGIAPIRGLQCEQPVAQYVGQTSNQTPAFFSDMPSFSLGLSQDPELQPSRFHPGYATPVTQPQEDPIDHILLSDRCHLIQATFARNNPRRATKMPDVLRSPYVNRVVDIRNPTTRDEDKIWNFLFQPGLADQDCLFAHENGPRIERGQMQTMQPRGVVDEAVIDCWSLLLNHEELARNPNSPNRFFCPVSAVTYDMILNQRLNPLEKAVMFQQNIMQYINIAGTVKPVHTYDLVLLPVCDGNHYFLLCLDLKNPVVWILDNMVGKPREPVIIELHKQIMASFLEISGYDKAAAIATAQPVRFYLKWASDINMDDSGIFLMRHMETFKGKYAGGFNAGFAPEGAGQVKQMIKLRVKYTTKLVLSKLNLFKPKVVAQAVKLAKAGRQTRKDGSDGVDLFAD